MGCLSCVMMEDDLSLRSWTIKFSSLVGAGYLSVEQLIFLLIPTNLPVSAAEKHPHCLMLLHHTDGVWSTPDVTLDIQTIVSSGR